MKEIDYLARTIYGEARGENTASKKAVAWVIRNRVEAPAYGRSYEEVVLRPYQFSCWNKNDPNYPKISSPDMGGRAWYECLGIAYTVYYAPRELNPLPEVYHFYDSSMDDAPPWWAESGELVLLDNVSKFRFVRGIK